MTDTLNSIAMVFATSYFGFTAINPAFLTAILIGAYLIGSIPFGLILTRLCGLGDIRKIGSGNIGATNVLRTGNKKIAALTLLLDGLKGFVPVFAIPFVAPFLAAQGQSQITLFMCIGVAGIVAILGHCFPVWLRFKGGKGVATGIGVLLGFNWVVGLAVAATWLLMAVSFRISSLSALIAMILAPVYMYIFGDIFLTVPTLIVTLIIYVRHHQNIARLIKGEEPKIGKKK